PEADPAVVVRDCLDEIRDGVVGVGALVDVVGLERIDELRPVVNEYPFRMAQPPDVLVCEDIAVLDKLSRAEHAPAIGIGPVWPRAIRRALEKNGMPAGLTLRNVNGGVKAGAVAHRD